MIKTTSLELSKQLKEAGFPQFGIYFAWAKVAQKRMDGNGYDWEYEVVKNYFQADIEFIAAPTAEEILEYLPDYVRKYFNLQIGKNDGEYFVWYRKRKQSGDYEVLKTERNKILAEALGKMYLFLKKGGLL